MIRAPLPFRARASGSGGTLPESVISYYVRNLRRVLPRRRRLVAFLFASIMHALGHAVVALVAGAIALSLAERWGLRDNHAAAVPAANSSFLLALSGLAFVIVKGAAGVYATYVQAKIAGDAGSSLRLEVLDALLARHRLRHLRHDDHMAGASRSASPGTRAVGALTDRVRDLESGLEQGLLGGARAAAQLVPLAALLVALSARMAAVAAVVLVGFGWALGRARAGYREATRCASGERERLLEAADEAVRHADVWVTYGAEAKARASVHVLGDAISSGSARLQARATALSSANEALGALALVAAIAASRAGWLGAIADGGTLLAFAFAFFLAYRPTRELTDARLALARAQGAYEEMRLLIGGGASAHALADRAEDAHADAAEDRAWPLATLELRALRLARGASGPVSVLVEAGTVVAIVGPTGVGKTTLIRTLLGLERSAGGDVLFDGESLSAAPAGPRARPFAWVPQDAPLLADTLRANVGLGADGADPREQLDRLGAGHLMLSLEGARLGAGGRPVSGGERQWIALARAIATRQPVLLLDEPTSGLDAEAQRRVLDAIARLRGSRTVLLVTHRPEPLAIADVVVRLQDVARAAE